MPSGYATRVFADGADTCLTTGTSTDWIRKLSIGNNWTRIRLGVLVAMTPNGISNINGRLWVGMNSGTDQPANSATCRNWVGARITSAGVWRYLAGGGQPYYDQANAGYDTVAATKRNNTVTTAAGSAVQPYCASNGAGTQRRTCFWVEITKGSPNYTVAVAYLTSALVVADFRKSQFLDYASVWLTAAMNYGWSGAVLGKPTAATIACDETAGDLDSVNVYVSAATSMDIYAITAHKVY